MARRTVENINGFVSARPLPVSSKKPPAPVAPGRPRTTTVAAVATASGRKFAPSKPTTNKAPTPSIKKKEHHNARPLAKVEKPQRNVAEKKLPVSVKIKQEVKVEQNEVEIKRKNEKVIDTIENCSVDCSPEKSDEEEYEDDFEDYESDFESDTSIDSIPETSPPQPVAVNELVSHGSGVKFALPTCVEEKLEPFLDEKYEVNALERTIELGLKNFKTAGKRKREQEAKDKVQTRGSILMEMIKLDTVSYTLLDLPAIPYEQYIKIYGRSNMMQVQTQTHDDNAEKEVQTNDIDVTEKWTQRPIVLENGLDCSSAKYFEAKLGVGGGTGRMTNGAGRSLTSTATVDSDRVCVVGRAILSMLEQHAMDRAGHRLAANRFDLDFSNGHLSPAVSTVKFLANRPVTSVEFVRITSPTEFLVTTHEVMDLSYQYVMCVWSVSNTENPEFVLKCPNRVTSICTVLKSTGGFVVAAHADGSICLWDLRESRLHHQQIDGVSCPIRSPSFNTALSVDQGHKSKIVGLHTVTYSNVGATNEELPDEICSLDEDFVLNVWTVVDSWADVSEVAVHKSVGTAPWSSVRLMKTQTLDANKSVPRYLSDGVAATCMCLNNNQEAFIGTNSGRVYRCNLGEYKVWPSYYTSEDTGEHFSINWLNFCPFDTNYFLAACSRGEVMLYSVSRREALRRFLAISEAGPKASASIAKAEWCTGFPGIVFGLDSLSRLHVWDFCDDEISTPFMSTSFRGQTVTSMSLTTTRENQNTFMGLAFTDGAVEIHQVKLEKRTSASVAAPDDNSTDQCDLLARFLASL